MSERSVLLVIHPSKPDALSFAHSLARALVVAGFKVFTNHAHPSADMFPLTDISGVEIAIVLGGDGTILRAAELTHGHKIPVLGINMGNVGFLAEIDRPSVERIVDGVVNRSYKGESRLVLHYTLERAGSIVETGWALNEITIGRSDSQMIELFVQIDGRPLSRWGCDGVIASTPTGSTAYAFSAGGPVVWPEVSAIILLPLAAHALYSRPMVISPDSTIAIDIESTNAELSSDGMRTVSVQEGDRVTISREVNSIDLVHLDEGAFTDRLVAKFKLPVEGWRGE